MQIVRLILHLLLHNPGLNNLHENLFENILCITVLFAFNSCRKKAPDFNERLVGFWFGYEGCTDIIENYPNGSGHYSVYGNSMECNSGVRSEGKVLCNKNSILIGVEKFYPGFVIRK